MVGFLQHLGLLIAQAANSPWSRLEPEQRARLGGALALIAAAGVAIVFFAWIALRAGRRNSQREDLSWKRLNERAGADDWATKPLIQPDDVSQDSDLE